MSIVSSSHTPQGRGEEKGANYKWPHPVLPDFSSSGIGPRIHFGTSSPSARSAATAGSSTVSRSARRGGKVPSAGGAGAGAASRAPVAAPGSSPPPVPRGHRARASPLPAAAASGAHRRGAPCPGAQRPRGARPGGAPGEKSLSPARAVKAAVERGVGGTPPLPRGFQSAFSPSPPTVRTLGLL